MKKVKIADFGTHRKWIYRAGDHYLSACAAGNVSVLLGEKKQFMGVVVSKFELAETMRQL